MSGNIEQCRLYRCSFCGTDRRRFPYVDARNNLSYLSAEWIKEHCSNWQSVDYSGINHLVINCDSGQFQIIQAGGYSYDKGLFSTLY